MITESRAEFATFAATVDALRKLNMEEHSLVLRPDSLDVKTGEFFLDCEVEAGRRETVGRIYKCRIGYHCIVVDEDVWQAPIVWNGPRASWDASTDAETLTEFAASVRKALTTEV